MSKSGFSSILLNRDCNHCIQNIVWKAKPHAARVQYFGGNSPQKHTHLDPFILNHT